MIIMCAKCGTTVVEIERFEDPSSLHTVFTVRCHGSEETLRLSRKNMVEITSITGGIAFQEKLHMT